MAQCQMMITRTSLAATPMTANTWTSLLLKKKRSGNTKSFSKFRVCALKSENNTITGLRVFSTWMSLPTLMR
ncbi:hypothetical protein BT93_B0807 [Corymbia citriodora subsp. variegata]|nr:hypothetical protein BT93_B0807 [Corymbia citriodora subsp. variegata]